MTPLDKIKNWLEQLDPEIARELLMFANHFHPVKEIRDSSSLNGLPAILPYLDSTGLEVKEICARTLVSIQLINYALEGRGTDKFWQDAIDKNLDLRSHIRDNEMNEKQKAGMNETLDKVLSGFPERKEAWKKICDRWDKLLSADLTNKQITDWYFTETHR